ncbi:MAG: glycoside hydrolase family 2 TIM barrel-domain containing protein [Chitinophagaceae bacterium]
MQTKKVFILKQDKHYTLYRDGQPFSIKGAAGISHLSQLQQAGGNTLRTWDTLNIGAILNDAAAHNIAVIAGLALPHSTTQSFYEDTAQVAAQLRAYREVVRKYKSHPALLMWCLGNEIDFPYKPRFKRFYKTFTDLVKMIHEEDPDHPVTTALESFSRRCVYNIRLKIPQLDFISINTFGKLSSLQDDLDRFSWFWNGPYLISEWGINGPWEAEKTAWGSPIENTSGKKAEHYAERYKYIPVNDPRFLGACVFFWGQKQEGTPTWFSLFSGDSAASESVNTITQIWTGKRPPTHAPRVKYMLLEGKGARDNILLNPDSMYHAELLMEEPPGDSIRVRWEILEEDWFRKSIIEPSIKKTRNYNNLLLPGKGLTVSFRTPPAEGPYRLFVTVFDKKGYFSTANTPFYVTGK